jgi:hypothetical protein
MLGQSETRTELWQDIPLVKEGSEDTLLSASRVNEIIMRLNALSNMRGEGGCRVVKSGGNIVVTTDGL